jgi:hypothetical protein
MSDNMAAAALKRVVAIETTILFDHTFDLGGKQPLEDSPGSGGPLLDEQHRRCCQHAWAGLVTRFPATAGRLNIGSLSLSEMSR